MKSNRLTKFNWNGSEQAYLNMPSIEKHQHMTIGRYGSYTLGRRELRSGINHIMLITDGYLEAAKASISLPEVCRSEGLLVSFLNSLHDLQTRDSTTLVHWAVKNELDAALPSDW